jgi:alginate O-acetyltransferase complex protein AlgI
MLFNSVEFLIFLFIVFILYWFVLNRHLKVQNSLLIIAGYVFYGWWDWRFLSLLIFSSTFDYILGLKIYNAKTKAKSKAYLIGSIIINLGLLGLFKYYNFFVDSFIDLFQDFGIHLGKRTLNIVLPVGISFYTFQSMSYTIDLYRRKLEPTRDIIAYFSFVSFFPQLLAGPIERAVSLLPQFHVKREFDIEKAKDGLRQILWGFFKKVVLADTCANNVDYIFNNYESLDGSVLFLGVVYFAFQIYGDFSGYSDIAIGTARLFGFNLRRNFAFPYFSRDIAEYWRRWHMSLSSWFRDYVYIPLGGSYGSKLSRIRNIIITFTISGFWHGANWTFVFWGFLNGAYYIPLMLTNRNKQQTPVVAENSFFPRIGELIQMLTTFLFTLFAWIFFRSVSMHEAFAYIRSIWVNGLFHLSVLDLRGRGISSTLIDASIAIVFVLIIEWIQRKKQHGLQFQEAPLALRWTAYWVLTFISLFYFGNERTFIYFQF